MKKINFEPGLLLCVKTGVTGVIGVFSAASPEMAIMAKIVLGCNWGATGVERTGIYG